MALSALRRDILTFSRGFTSDASSINFPLDFSVDEQNYDIQIDGTRKRRRGLSQDAGLLSVNVNRNDTERTRVFKWPAAANDTSVNFVVVQFGRAIKFFEDADDATIPSEATFSIDLSNYKTATTTNAEIDGQTVDMAVSKGDLLIVGQYSEPIVVTYLPATASISVAVVTITERDLFGIEDSTPNAQAPPTLTDSHLYNLVNQGWTTTKIDQFFTDKAMYPAKNMVYSRAFRRTTVAGIADVDGTKGFSSDKLVAELFQDAPAPRGHFIVNPFNTELNPISETSGTIYSTVSGVVFAVVGFDNELTFTTTAAHGLVATDTAFVVTDALFTYVSTIDGSTQSFTITGQTLIVDSAPTGTTFKITNLTFPYPDFDQINATLVSPFSIVKADALITNPEGSTIRQRPSTVAFYAGRIWYAGINSGKLTTKILFSQVVETRAQYGKAYQVADPTDENISDLVATDGGSINIPEMGTCFRIVPYSSSLLVFAFNGVWAIEPGANGIFAADSYSIRKLSEIGVDGPASIVIAENLPHYWGRNSIYRIGQDPQRGFLVSQNISINRIDTFYNGLSVYARSNVQSTYDPLSKKIYWIYSSFGLSGEENPGMDRILIYDFKYDAFVKMTLPHQEFDLGDTTLLAVGSIFAVKTPDPTAPQTAIKFVAHRFADTVFAEFNAAGPEDINNTEQEAFLLTGFDTGGVPSNRKQALYIVVYSKKTEDGYTEVGTEFIPNNESSTLMQARWDWSDHANAGKWGPSQQIYRHLRQYVPDETVAVPGGPLDNFDDGTPIVVTRNKIRGRGRALHLKFSAGEGYHSHLMGWTTNYRILTEN